MSTMKRPLFWILTVFVTGLMIWGVTALWNVLRGIGPAVTEPPQNIATLIESESNQAPGSAENATDFPLKLPDGFRIDIFAKDLGAVRVLVRDPAGTMVASIPKAGLVIALPDTDKDGKADRSVPILENLSQPHGLAFAGDRFFVAENDQVTSYVYDGATHTTTDRTVVMSLPGSGSHLTRSLFVHNDRLLVAIGSSCNACEESDDLRGSIQSIALDGTNPRPFATGLRNSVFQARHPLTGEIWGTEMGRDLLGDDLPPDEINILREGADYGWPYCYGGNIHDQTVDPGQGVDCTTPAHEPSTIDLPAHSAPLGLTFLHGSGWPDDWQNNLIVAFHGSWNRTVPTGYKLVRYQADDQGILQASDFVSGWLTPEGALGRPVSLLADPDGNLYLSDDKANLIYRIHYQG